MGTILMSLVLLFGCAPLFAESYFPVGKESSKTTYSKKESCEAKEGQDCFDVTDKDMRYYKVSLVSSDDKSKPLYKDGYKTHVCDNIEQCGKIMNEKKASEPCDEGDDYFRKPNSLAPGYKIFCSRVIGYEQIEQKSLVIDAALKASVEAADKKLNDKAAMKVLIEKNMAFGEDLKKEISIINIGRNLSEAQVQEFVDTFESINRLLDAGAIQTARSAINGLTPDESLLRQQDKTEILGIVDAYLAELNNQ